MLKKLLNVVYAILAGGLILSACQPAATPAPAVSEATALPTMAPTLAPGSVQLVAQGATFPLPVYDVWTRSFQFVDPAVNITYAGTGSGAGKKAIVDGTVDFAGSDSVLTTEYQTVADLQMLPTLAGAVVPIFNLQSTDKDANGNAVIVKDLVLDRQTAPRPDLCLVAGGKSDRKPGGDKGRAPRFQDYFPLHRSAHVHPR